MDRADTLERNPGFINPNEINNAQIVISPQNTQEAQSPVVKQEVLLNNSRQEQQVLIITEQPEAVTAPFTINADALVTEILTQGHGAPSNPTAERVGTEPFAGDYGFGVEFKRISSDSKSSKYWEVWSY